MFTFVAPDGTELAYQVKGEAVGDRHPVVCIPGGPMRDPDYLGDLGGLSARRQMIILHLRGTGGSAVPAEPASWRCDRQVADVDALRVHLGLDRLDLVAHSAGCAIAILYAAAHPQRVACMTLITPSLRVLGLATTDEDQDGAMRLRAGEPWFEHAYAAARRIVADPDNVSDEDWNLVAPFSYGRWDDAARRHDQATTFNEPARANYFSDDSVNPEATKAALRSLGAPVLILAGEYDANPRPHLAAIAAGWFPNGCVSVQAGAGHYPWVDDSETFGRLTRMSRRPAGAARPRGSA